MFISEISNPPPNPSAATENKGLQEPSGHLAPLAREPAPQAPIANPGKSLRARLHLRTRELASIAGRGPLEVTQGNYEQAKREVTGESTLNRQNAVLDGSL